MVIPLAATVYAQVVTSSFFRRCNTFEPIHLPNGTCVVPPADVARCSGAAAVHDLQLGQVTLDSFTALTPPIPVFRYLTAVKCCLCCWRLCKIKPATHGLTLQTSAKFFAKKHYPAMLFCLLANIWMTMSAHVSREPTMLADSVIIYYFTYFYL